MSFIAGYIAGLEEGGDTYRNEPKTITENGIYIPDSGVRWNEVTVDVRTGTASLNEIINLKKLPIKYTSYGGTVSGDYEYCPIGGEEFQLSVHVELTDDCTSWYNGGVGSSYKHLVNPSNSDIGKNQAFYLHIGLFLGLGG